MMLLGVRMLNRLGLPTTKRSVSLSLLLLAMMQNIYPEMDEIVDENATIDKNE
jgi:hypothetical protein